jgi:ethanolamine ammonia-lyase small subunit
MRFGMDTSKSPLVTDNTWQCLRRYTPARIALGRAGISLPTRPQLAFQFAHARARDAVHLPLDKARLQGELVRKGYEVVVLHSAAADRHVYLQRPDLGRRLDDDSRYRLEERSRLAAVRAGEARQYDAAFVIADGLSAFAIHQNAVPFLDVITAELRGKAWRLAPIALVEQGRVAIGDEIGELVGARMVAVLIGERPGLSSPDSLGIYLTYQPRPGLTDADRNCISNVREGGLSFGAASHKLFYLMREARRRKLTGVMLKDEAEVPLPAGSCGNFLIDSE